MELKGQGGGWQTPRTSADLLVGGMSSTAGRCLSRGTAASGGAGGQAHGMTELAVADDLALKRRATAQLAAQLADDALGLLVHMYALTDQRRAIAIHTAVAIGSQRANATTQKETLELLDIDVGRGHGRYFRQGSSGSCTLQ
ncbi:MAG TPA: hypothetical protein VIJ50_09535 [Solirubrobacteraceae bacterium]